MGKGPAGTGKDAAAPPRPAAGSSRDRRSSARRDGADAYALGITHLARGDEIEALQAFRDYLRGSGQPPARRAEAEHYAIDLARKFGEVVVICRAPGAQVSLDGARTLARSAQLDRRACGLQKKPGR